MDDAVALLGLLDDDAILLDEAALAIAALDRPGIDLAPYTERLGTMASEIFTRGSRLSGARDRAELLADVIADDHGFHGDTENYDDPANADLISVMDRGQGLPVALSILYVALARRVGWEAHPLNTPGHVLVRMGSEPSSVVQDPFAGGAVLDDRGVARLIARMLGSHVVPEPGHFVPLSNRSALVRLLSNQATRARRNGDLVRALELHERMTAFAPSYTALWWEKARIEQLLGRAAEARASLGAMLETTRDGVIRSRVRAALDALARSTN